MENFIIGGLGAAISRTITAPIELYRIQKQNYFVPNSNLRDVINKEGIRYLWKGNGVNCIRIFPQMSINWGTFKFLNNNVNIKDEKTKHLINAFISGSLSMMCIYPLETIRSRLSLQLNHNHYTNFIQAFKKIPFKDLYGGLRMSLFGYAPFNSISFTSYHYYKKNIYDNKLLCGGLSGITALTITYPSDLIRRRLQIQNFDKSVPKYKGIIDCIRTIFNTEGIRGLYRGLLVSYFKCFPTLAIQFYSIDLITNLYKNNTNI